MCPPIRSWENFPYCGNHPYHPLGRVPWTVLNGRVLIPTMAWPQIFILTLKPHWLSWEPLASISRTYLMFPGKWFIVPSCDSAFLGCLPLFSLLLQLIKLSGTSDQTPPHSVPQSSSAQLIPFWSQHGIIDAIETEILCIFIWCFVFSITIRWLRSTLNSDWGGLLEFSWDHVQNSKLQLLLTNQELEFSSCLFASVYGTHLGNSFIICDSFIYAFYCCVTVKSRWQ